MSLSELAARLAESRREHTQLAPDFLESLNSEAEAYEVQSLLEASYGATRIGYKVGATNETSQKMFDCDGPFYGPVFDTDCHVSGATIDVRDGLLGGEAEFAFVIDRDVPTETPIDAKRISDFIRASHVAVELVGRRTQGEGLPSLFGAIADFGGNADFIRGPAIENWHAIDLASVEVTATVDGAETNAGSGAAVLGHPLNSVAWLHEKLRTRGGGLKAGEWITTGTCLGVIAPVPGSDVHIRFNGCGEVSYRLSR